MVRIRDYDEEIRQLEAAVEARHGAEVLGRLQAVALMRPMTPKEAVDFLSRADVIVEEIAAFEAMMGAPSGAGADVAAFLVENPHLDASPDDVADLHAEWQQRREGTA